MNTGKAKITPSKKSLPDLRENARAVPLWWREVVRLNKDGLNDSEIARKLDKQYSEIMRILDRPQARFLRGRCRHCRAKIPMAAEECAPCFRVRMSGSKPSRDPS